MILVDTSVWIDHLRQSNAMLERLLSQRQILSQPFVVGELAVGNLQPRDAVLDQFDYLTKALVIGHQAVLDFIQQNKLFGLGIGYIDCHLLATVVKTPGTSLWTRDKRLMQAAKGHGVAIISDLA